jgi:hypothetical protein
MNKYNNPSFATMFQCVLLTTYYHNMFRLKCKPSSGVIVIIILNVSYYNISGVLVDIRDGGIAYICVGNCVYI